MQWIVEACSLFLAAFILVGGSLGDHFGRRRIFATGIAIFTLASVWCGLSPNVLQLIRARAIQGIGGGICLLFSCDGLCELLLQRIAELLNQVERYYDGNEESYKEGVYASGNADELLDFIKRNNQLERYFNRKKFGDQGDEEY